MGQYLQVAVRAFGVSAILVIVAVASRQVYLRVAAEAGSAGGEEDPAAMMLIRCEAMHSRLQNRPVSEDAADADEVPRARCMES
ncbi:hypothetical protein P3W85_35730 [Cupriavidus basilensis]|uniref:Secreted protein n=1 Tax=Cupriavidus basilensis TaxID=68895 RepID=A0ABT6B033_9BURK|nr:hypothetical protein [Cupriavidus basilensis]MDF3838245.1 hypothetical protein [Cupriavidus basilensis]